MATWESVVSKAKELTESAARKATDIVDLAKLKLELADNENAIKATYEAIGRLAYQAARDGAQDSDTLTELMNQVDELTAANAELIDKIDRNRNRKTCSACGTANEETASYCKHCGNSL